MPARVKSRLEESRKIFNEDPLLLNGKNQESYGKLILKNLLVNRTITTSVPWFVDLHDEESRGRFLKRRPPVPRRPSSKLVEKYQHAFRERSNELSRSQTKALQRITMLANGSFTARRGTVKGNDNSRTAGSGEGGNKNYRDHDAALRGFRDKKQKALFKKRFRVAAIGHRVRISRLEDTSYLNEVLVGLSKLKERPVAALYEASIDDELGRTRVRQEPCPIRAWEAAVVTNVSNALRRQSQIVLLPEFALPPGRQLQDKDDKLIEQQLRQLSSDAKYDHFLMAGTRHESKYNRGFILANQRHKVSDDWWHYKAASAKSLHENVMGPYGERIPTYMTKLDNLESEQNVAIAVGVCYDAFDPTMFLNLLVQAFKHGNDNVRHFLLVPSFNPSSDLVALLRDFSFLSRCIVVYVNALHGDAEMFISGFSVTDFADRSGEIVRAINAKIRELHRTNKNETSKFSRGVTRGQRYARDDAETERVRKRLAGIKALTNLRDSLLSQRARGSFKHIITYEPCPQCGSHTEEDYCRKDTLYFNIDPGLIGALDMFRSSPYFGDDRFLPEPFWPNEMQESVKWVEDRVNRRREEYGEPLTNV